jgi:hypothetical protein
VDEKSIPLAGRFYLSSIHRATKPVNGEAQAAETQP